MATDPNGNFMQAPVPQATDDDFEPAYKKPPKKKGGGRPKGSKNRPKTAKREPRVGASPDIVKAVLAISEAVRTLTPAEADKALKMARLLG